MLPRPPVRMPVPYTHVRTGHTYAHTGTLLHVTHAGIFSPRYMCRHTTHVHAPHRHTQGTVLSCIGAYATDTPRATYMHEPHTCGDTCCSQRHSTWQPHAHLLNPRKACVLSGGKRPLPSQPGLLGQERPESHHRGGPACPARPAPRAWGSRWSPGQGRRRSSSPWRPSLTHSGSPHEGC